MATSSPLQLISQTEDQCLAVVSGTTPADAILGLADPGSSKEQQWIPCEGQWQWCANPSFCLAPSKNTLCLAESSSSSSRWMRDEKGRLVCDSRALTVPRNGNDKSRVGMRPLNNKINQKWLTDEDLRVSLRGSAAVSYPLPSDAAATIKQEIARGFLNKLAPLTEPLPFPRAVTMFPGVVEASTSRIEKTLTLDLSILGQEGKLRMTTPRDWQATDLYVAPGDIFQIFLPDDLSSQRAGQIVVRVGAHTDRLQSGKGTSRMKGFKRMPVVSEHFRVRPGVNSLRSQYGGNLIFVYQKGELFQVEVKVANVVKAPYFKRGETTADEWEASKVRDAPHAVLESERVVVVVKSNAVAEIPFPEELMTRYEQVLDHLNSLAGFSENNPPPRGKFWLVNDVQVSHGSAHAGFPAMFTQGIRNLADMQTPYHWAVWHELGHNYQQARLWGRTFGIESTVNLFSLYIQEKLFNRDRIQNKKCYQNTATAVDEGLKFNAANNWQKLVFLMEIKHHFADLGWEIFRKLHHSTRNLSQEEAEKLGSNPKLQVNYVYKTLSKIVGQDLILTFQRWGFDVGKAAQEEIQGLDFEKAPADISIRE